MEVFLLESLENGKKGVGGSPLSDQNALAGFHPLVLEWFRARYGSPTAIQSAAWPKIRAGGHCLVIAPTGSGKTLTAFLSALDRLIRDPDDRGVMRVLYVSPLKALNNDIERNLLSPLGELAKTFADAGRPFPEIHVRVRSGDTPESERRKILKRPPEVFITTPESLNLILSSPRGRSILSTVTTVILDEIHAVVSEKRGTHLITAVERTARMAGEFQRIAISATVRPADKVASFVAGPNRRIDVVTTEEKKAYDLSVVNPPTPVESETADDAKRPTGARFEALSKDMYERIKHNRSTLIFVTTRSHAEKVSTLLNTIAVDNGEEPPAYAHHGSLSREIRTVVERRMKEGMLPAIVATNSLELGIDIGPLDEVFLVKTPATVAATLQRVGRAGHRVGETSRACFYPLAGRDFLDAAVMVEAVLDGAIEEHMPMRAPLDVLAQVIVSMCSITRWRVDELFSFFRSTAPYQDLARTSFDAVLEMLAGRYQDSRISELKPRIRWDRIEGTVEAMPGVSAVLYSSGGTIPDRGYFALRTGAERARVGELDEEFVWERRVGDVFAFGNKRWEITAINDKDVEVVPTSRLPNATAFWRGEAPNRSFTFGRRLLEFLDRWGERTDDPAFEEYLRDELGLDTHARDALRELLDRQRAITGTGLPGRRRIVVEAFSEPADTSSGTQILIHTLWGGRINHPLSLVLSAAWEEATGSRLDMFADNDAILIMLPAGEETATEELVRALRELAPDRIVPLLRSRLESSGFFGGRFRENAGRALLLPKKGFAGRTPLWLNRIRAKRILERVSKYSDFPILTETWRQCLQDEFDIETLVALVGELNDGDIDIEVCATSAPSPFASSLIWQRTNFFMYESDLPNPRGESALSNAVIEELVDQSQLRPTMPIHLIEELRSRLKRTAPGYGPESERELRDFLDERVFIPVDEFAQHAASLEEEIEPANYVLLIRRPAGSAGGSAEEEAEERARDNVATGEPVAVASPEGAARFYCAGVPVDYAAFGPGAPAPLAAERMEAVRRLAGSLEPERSAIARAELVRAFVRYEACVPVERVVAFFHGQGHGQAPGTRHGDGTDLRELIEELRRSGELIVDRISDEGAGPSGAAPPQGATPQGAGSSSAAESPAVGGPVNGDGPAGRGGSPEGEAPRGPAEGMEVAERDNLERLLRMLRRERRAGTAAMQTHAPEDFTRLVATLHGIASATGAANGEGAEGGEADPAEVVDRLSLYPAPAAVWEADLLAPRLAGASVNRLLASGDFLWRGCGSGRLTFMREEDIDLPAARPAAASNPDEEANAGSTAIFPLDHGSFRFAELAASFAGSPEELQKHLWHEVWRGTVTSDSFDAVRNAVNSGSTPGVEQNTNAPASTRRSHLSRRSPIGRRPSLTRKTLAGPPGRWRPLLYPTEQNDAVEIAELEKEQARILLSRYGVVNRQICSRELPGMRWSKVFGALRLLELGGEAMGGIFFEGLALPQFASSEAMGTLGRLSEAFFWIHSMDPAALSGLGGLETNIQIPARAVGTHLVYFGRTLLASTKRHGRVVDFYTPANAEVFRNTRVSDGFTAFFAFLLARPAVHARRLVLESVNGRPTRESGYDDILTSIGFRRDYKGYILEKR